MLLCSTWHQPATPPDVRHITARKTGPLPLFMEKENLTLRQGFFGGVEGVAL